MADKKTIAVWGSPSSGKTTFATKLAQTIYDECRMSVILLYADSVTPVLPYVFPNFRKEDLYSVGPVLAAADITRDDVARQLMILRGRQNFGFLGFGDGENRYSYPSFGEERALALFSVLSELADCVVVDCMSGLGDPVSGAAVKNADVTVRLASPDLKSFSFFSSQLPLYADPAYRTEEQIQGINVPDADLFMPVEEAKTRMSDARFVIPFSRDVKEQLLEGRLARKTADRKFNSRIAAVAGKLVK